MAISSLNLNLKSSVSLSLILHGGLFALCLVAGARDVTVPLPVGVELMYGDDPTASLTSVPAQVPQKIAPQVVVVDDKDGVSLDKTKPEITPEPQVAAIAKTLGNPNGSSEKGALEGREGVRNGQEVSAEDRYLYELRKLLERKKRYPMMARKMGHEGRVLVSFTLSPDGSVTKSEVIEKAEFESLNEAAHDLVKSIHGAKPFPDEIHKTTWNITLPIDFSLQ